MNTEQTFRNRNFQVFLIEFFVELMSSFVVRENKDVLDVYEYAIEVEEVVHYLLKCT